MIMEKKSQKKVRVVIRVRPALNDNPVCVEPSNTKKSVQIFNYRNSRENIQYEFSSVYDGKATQKDIFEECVDPLLNHSFQGQNVSIFAYGPTGAGKTHTMLGPVSDPGIIPRVMKTLFERINKEKSSGQPDLPKTVMTFSYMEIYNEKVRDLLSNGAELTIRQNGEDQIFVAGLKERQVDSFDDFQRDFAPASSKRSVAATKLNEHSSRSHSIVLLKVVRTLKDKEYVGKIHLIDLAGSEDNRRTGNAGMRLKESGAINRSLFALGEVVDAINKNMSRIPYRNSKLTRLLQDSLGGSCHSLMVTNIAPEEHYYHDTFCTLNFASKSKKIVNVTTTTINSLVPKQSLKRCASSDSELLHQPKKLKQQPASISSSSSSLKFQTSSKNIASSNSCSSTSTSKSLKSCVTETIKKMEKQLHKVRLSMSAKKHKRMSMVDDCDSTSDDIHSPAQRPRRSQRMSSSSSSLLLSPNSTNTMSSSGFDTTGSPDIISATPIMTKRKNALKDASNVFQNWFGKNKNKSHERLKRVLDSGPSCSPLFLDVPSNKKNKRKRSDATVTPHGKVTDRREDHLSLSWQDKRVTAFIDMLNNSSVKELQQLHTVGPKRAMLIFNWREFHGPFKQIEDLKEIPGITAKNFSQLLKNNLVTLDC